MTEVDVRSILKKVGRGKTLARDLRREEAREAMGLLLSGGFRPSQAGAFLQAMRIKEATLDELEGAMEGMGAIRRPAGIDGDLVVNLAFDTARKGGILSIPACALLNRAGLATPVVVWEPPSLFTGIQAVERSLEAVRAHPLLAEGECPMVEVRDLVDGWGALSGLRSELGFRTLLNTLEKLALPIPGVPVVVGISHGGFLDRLSRALLHAGASRAVVVRGHHGTCDLPLGRESVVLRVAAATGEDGEESVPLEPVEAPFLLAERRTEWPDLARSRDPAWFAAVQEQAAFLLSVARGIPLESARGHVRAYAGGDHGD